MEAAEEDDRLQQFGRNDEQEVIITDEETLHQMEEAGRFVVRVSDMFTPEQFAVYGPHLCLYWMRWYAERRN